MSYNLGKPRFSCAIEGWMGPCEQFKTIINALRAILIPRLFLPGEGLYDIKLSKFPYICEGYEVLRI